MDEDRATREAAIKILITTLGTRGDVQPYLALALGLQDAGHTVTLTTSANFTSWIESYGVGTHPTRFSVPDYMAQPEVKAIISSGNPVRQYRMMQDLMARSVEALDDMWAAAQETDFLIQSGTGSSALEAAELRRIPTAFAYLQPTFAPTRAFPHFMLPLRRTPGGGYNLLTHRLMHAMLWHGMAGPLTNKWRRTLDLPKWRSYGHMRAEVRRQQIPVSTLR